MNTGSNPFGDESTSVHPPDLGLPMPEDLYGYDVRRHPEVFAKAPWYQVRHLRNRGLLTQYADGSGILPDGLSMRAVWSRDYTRRLVVNPVALKPHHQPRTQNDKGIFVKFVQQRIARTRCVTPIPAAWDLDTWAYRCESDAQYVANLRRIVASLPAGQMPDLTDDLLAWSAPILPAQFMTQKQNYFPRGEWEKLKFERRQRNALGVFVAHEWIETANFVRDALRARYPPIPSWWEQYEVPPGLMAEIPPVIVYYGFAMIDDPSSPLWSVFTAEWLTIVAKRLLWNAREGRLFLLPDKVRHDLRDFEYHPALGLQFSDPSVSMLLDAMDAVDWSRVPAAQGHRFSREVNHSPGLTSDKSTKTSGYWVSCDGDTAKVTQTDLLRVHVTRALTRNSLRGARGSRGRKSRGVSMSHQARCTRRRDEEDVVMTDKQDESDTQASPPSKRREILPGLALSNEQLTALLADAGVRAAIARVGKNSTENEREKSSTVPSIKPLTGTSGAGAVDSTVATGPTSAGGLKGTGIRSAPVPPQRATTLLHQARTASAQSPDDNKSVGEESEHYEEEDEITPAPKVLRKTD